jgi:hypothetical protein
VTTIESEKIRTVRSVNIPAEPVLFAQGSRGAA